MTTTPHAFENVKTADAVSQQLEILARREDVVVRGALVAVDDPSRDITAVIEKRCGNVHTLWANSAARYIHIQTARIRRSEKKMISGSVLISPTIYDRVHIIYTLDSSEFVKELLIPLLDRCNPRLFLPYVTSKSLAKVILSLAHPINMGSRL